MKTLAVYLILLVLGSLAFYIFQRNTSPPEVTRIPWRYKNEQIIKQFIRNNYAPCQWPDSVKKVFSECVIDRIKLKFPNGFPKGYSLELAEDISFECSLCLRIIGDLDITFNLYDEIDTIYGYNTKEEKTNINSFN